MPAALHFCLSPTTKIVGLCGKLSLHCHLTAVTKKTDAFESELKLKIS